MTELLSFSDLFKNSIKFFRSNLKTVLALVLLIVLPLGVVEGVITEVMNKDAAVSRLFEAAANTGITEEEMNEAVSEAVPRMVPYVLLEALVLVLSLAYTVSIVKLTADNGINTVSYYFGSGIRLLPKIALTVLAGAAVSVLGFSLFFLPGVIVLVVTLIGVTYSVLSGETGTKSLVETGRVILKRPAIAAFYILGSAAVRGIAFVVNMGALLIPQGESPALIAANVAFSALCSCIGAVLTAIVDILTAKAMINTLEVSGYKTNEDGCLKRKEE